MPPNRFGPFSRPPLRGLLVIAAELHLSEHPFALQFFLQGSEGLINIIVANEDLHGSLSPLHKRASHQATMAPACGII
jgi:hypothetical protein